MCKITPNATRKLTAWLTNGIDFGLAHWIGSVTFDLYWLKKFAACKVLFVCLFIFFRFRIWKLCCYVNHKIQSAINKLRQFVSDTQCNAQRFEIYKPKKTKTTCKYFNVRQNSQCNQLVHITWIIIIDVCIEINRIFGYELCRKTIQIDQFEKRSMAIVIPIQIDSVKCIVWWNRCVHPFEIPKLG